MVPPVVAPVSAKVVPTRACPYVSASPLALLPHWSATQPQPCVPGSHGVAFVSSTVVVSAATGADAGVAAGAQAEAVQARLVQRLAHACVCTGGEQATYAAQGKKRRAREAVAERGQ